MRYIILNLFLLFFFNAFSQSMLSPDAEGAIGPLANYNGENLSEQMLESLNDQIAENPPMNTGIKFNINQVTDVQLAQTGKLSSLQIISFLNYRKQLGQIVELEELQAIPYWSAETAKLISEMMTIQIVGSDGILKKRWKTDVNEWMWVTGSTTPLSKGYLTDTATGKAQYMGPPVSFMLKIKQHFVNGIQLGICMENDKGEPVIFNKSYLLLDHVSKSVSYHSRGLVNGLVVGDYQLNLGLGLIQWQSFGMGQRTINLNSLINYAPVVKPYWGRGEDNFHTGIATEIKKNQWSLACWVSNRKKDAVLRTDSLSRLVFITSIISSGLHRTQSEFRSRKTVREKIGGIRISYEQNNFRIGLNAMAYQWDQPLFQDTTIANRQYSFAGNRLMNVSVDSRWLVRKGCFFGEAALAVPGRAAAMTAGCIFGVSDKLDMALLYRNISDRFESRYASSYTISYKVQNEAGISCLLNYTINKKIKWLLRVDLQHNPWINAEELKIKNAFMLQLAGNYMPNKITSINGSFSFKTIDNGKMSQESSAHSTNIGVTSKKLTVDVHHQFNKRLIFNTLMTIQSNHPDKWGWLFAFGWKWNCIHPSIKITATTAFYHVNDYSNRLFMAENALFGATQWAFIYDNGNRIIINAEKKFGKHVSASIYIAHNQYFNKNTIGSGYDLISGGKKTDLYAGLKWQL